MPNSDGELQRRINLWAQVNADNIEPKTLRSLLIYGGAQGIWVDKRNTKSLSTDGQGVTVSILYTGRHYPDDLSDDGVIYHYPTTRRTPGRDAARRSKLPRTLLTWGYRSSCFCLAKTAHQSAWCDWDGLWILMMRADNSLYCSDGKNRITTPLLQLKVRSSLSAVLPHGRP